MKKSAVAKMEAAIVCHKDKANGPMIFLSDTNLIKGTKANGSWTDCMIFR